MEVLRTIFKCARLHHIYPVTGGVATFIHRIGRDSCHRAVAEGRLSLFTDTPKPLHFSDLETGKTDTKDHTFAGWTDSYGYCGAGTYWDPFGSWDNVVVLGSVKLTLSSYTAKVNIEQDTIHLHKSVTGSYTKGKVMDDELGETFWSTPMATNCNTDKYNILYQGLSNLTLPVKNDGYLNSIVSVSENSMLFSLRITKQTQICGSVAFQTEHPKL